MDNCRVRLHPNPTTILGQKSVVPGCHLPSMQHYISTHKNNGNHEIPEITLVKKALLTLSFFTNYSRCVHVFIIPLLYINHKGIF